MFNGKDQLIIERFDVKKSIKGLEKHPELDQYDALEKLQLCIGYIFSNCKKSNGNMRYSWRNDKKQDVAVCYVFLGEQATEIQKLVEDFHNLEKENAKNKQSQAEEFMDDSKLYYTEISPKEILLKKPLKKLTLIEKVKRWIVSKF